MLQMSKMSMKSIAPTECRNARQAFSWRSFIFSVDWSWYTQWIPSTAWMISSYITVSGRRRTISCVE